MAGPVLKYDISLPPSKFEEFAKLIYPNREKDESPDFFFGHVGDGNMHYNIVFQSKH